MEFTIRRWTRPLALLAALTLSGCAATSPDAGPAEPVAAYKSVAIVSMLNENTEVQDNGLTVFNNKTETIDHQGALNRIATEVAEQHLRARRPDLALRSTTADAQALARKNTRTMPFAKVTANVSDDLRAIAKASDADLLFVILDIARSNRPGRGVGVVLQHVPLQGKKAYVHAHLQLVLIDRNGKEISNSSGGGGGKIVSPSDLGLRKGLDAMSDTAVREKVTRAMQKNLKEIVEQAATSLVY